MNVVHEAFMEMIMTAENQSPWSKPHLGATLSAINPTCTGPRLNPGSEADLPRRVFTCKKATNGVNFLNIEYDKVYE
jgi:hypothetical protein